MTLLAELNLKQASWQHKFIFVPRALFDIGKSNFVSILEELPNQDKSTDSQQAESSTVAGIFIRDSKGKEYDTIHLVFDRYILTSSLKNATRERRRDGKPFTDYHMEESTYVGKVTAKQFLSSTHTK